MKYDMKLKRVSGHLEKLGLYCINPFRPKLIEMKKKEKEKKICIE